MDLAQFLTDILIVLVAAKAAAEISERIGIPAVVGEIVAGVIVGPSVLGLVDHGDEVLVTLGEVGVILLLLEVGMEMDLGELGKVGKASLRVAVIGVVLPLVLGYLAMGAITDDGNVKLFVAAALTATSVGITARVFGDLRALATTEARLVLGAAVADDVIGLVVLTVVVRLVTEGGVSLTSVAGIVALAVAFLVVGGFVGLKLADPLFSWVDRVSRSTGTLVALGFAFALGFARLADAANLAPIVGAFVAGIALSRAKVAPRIQRELAPVGHLFIPVFFLQIGIDADVGAFFSLPVLVHAALLLVVAVVGKVASSLGAFGSRGDKALIGLGMLPRGEVGLIFATIGLTNGIIDDELYAALLLVVLVTTLMTPPLLKYRYGRLRTEVTPAGPPADTPPPAGGWLRVADGEIGLVASPPVAAGGMVGLEAAILAGRHRPDQGLLDWLADLSDDAWSWDADSREAILEVIERGNARSWRFLRTIGLLGRMLPELEEALVNRDDQVGLDDTTSYRLVSIERLRTLDGDDPLALEVGRLDDVDALLLALLVVDAADGGARRAAVAAATAERLGFDPARVRRVVALAEDGDELLWAAAHRPGALSEGAVLPLAAHLETPERARALYALTALRQGGQERWERDRLAQLHELLQSALTDAGLTATDARSLVARRRQDAVAAAGEAAAERIETLPTSFVLRCSVDELAVVAGLVVPAPKGDEVRFAVVPRSSPAATGLAVAARDRPGLLAVVSGVLADGGLDVRRAVVATWADGVAVELFEVAGGALPPVDGLHSGVVAGLRAPIEGEPLEDALVRFDADASPWHTICEVEAPDEPGLLHRLATAFAAAGVDVVAASIAEHGDDAVDTFELVDRDGAKLGPAQQEEVRRRITEGATLQRRRFRGLVAR